MRAPSIQRTAALSALLHLAVLVLSIILIKYSKNIVMPSPYTVSLVSPGKAGHTGPSVSRSETVESPVSPPPRQVKEDRKMSDAGKNAAAKKNDEKTLNDSLKALAAKRDVERIVGLRKLISVKSSGTKSPAKPSEKEGASGGSKATGMDTYIAKITEEIWREWVYPDFGKKDLQAIVSVIIRRDGTITVLGVEKKSGDLFFDRAALKAITKASPVFPPPDEMEIGIRFSP